MFKKVFATFGVLCALTFALVGCQASLSSSGSVEYGSISIETKDSASRALDISTLTTATVTVSGYGMTDISKTNVAISSGTGSVIIENIPVGKNRVVTVQSNVDGAVIRALVDIVGGEVNKVSVNWSTTATASVFYNLIQNKKDVSSISKTYFDSYIPDVHASLVDSASIASDYISGKLSSSNSYILDYGTVSVTATDLSGYTLQITDVASSKTKITSASQTFELAAYPGSWKVWVLDASGILAASKDITVKDGSTVTLDLTKTYASEFDGIQVQVAKSLGYPLIHYWNCSDSSTYANTTWPGIAMLTDWSDSDYIYNFEGCSKVSLLITKSDQSKLYSENIDITAKGSYRITSSGKSSSTYISNGKNDGTVKITIGSVPNPGDGYTIHVYNSSWSGTHYLYGYTGSTDVFAKWPGAAMTAEEGGYYYSTTTDLSSVNLIFNNNSSQYPAHGSSTKVNFPSGATEAWFNLSSKTWTTTNPNKPSAPTVSISPASGSIGTNGSISVTFTNGNDAITSAKVTVNGTEYNMGTTAGTWSKSLSELGITAEGVTVNVSAAVTNSAGTGTASATLTTKAPSGLVSNFNELRIYQVMVSSFQDGDSSIGYGTAYGPSGALTGGDLQGIINAVDYIKALGCNALWMTPIFQSAGNGQLDSTGYFCSDYFNVDYHFGSNSKFAELVETYHNAGINVILDGVFGHHGGSVANSPSGYNVSGKNPVIYTDTNTQNFYKEVAAYWIKNYKIDGWRLDQCYQVGLGEEGKGDGDNCQTGGHNYWYDIRKVVESAAASNGTAGTDWGALGYMVGEHWKGDAALIQKGSINPGSAGGYGLRSCFDFPSRYKIINALAKAESDAGGESLGSNLSYVYGTYSSKGYTHPEGYYPNLFVTNHDLVRLGNLINWKHGETPNSANYWKRHKLSLAIVAAYTGPITIYYGDEWGAYVDGYTGPGALGAYNDNAARSTGKISGFSSNESDLLSYAKALMEMRAEHEALWNGTSSDISASGNCYVGKKVGGGETIIFAINNGSSSSSFSATGTDLITGETVSGTATVGAYSARFILCK